MGVVITFLAMWSIYLVIVMISPLRIFERTLRTALNILMYIFYLKQKNTRQEEKNSKGFMIHSLRGQAFSEMFSC